MENLDWKDQKKEMEEMLKIYEKIESDVNNIKAKGMAWSYVGSQLNSIFYRDMEEIKEAIKEANYEIQLHSEDENYYV